jgi:hypothetical protein
LPVDGSVVLVANTMVLPHKNTKLAEQHMYKENSLTGVEVLSTLYSMASFFVVVGPHTGVVTGFAISVQEINAQMGLGRRILSKTACQSLTDSPDIASSFVLGHLGTMK